MIDIKKRIMVATQKEKADLVLKNCNVLNVFSEEFINADIAIVDGYIAGVGNYNGIKEDDCTNKFVCPGFIDAHMHIESTMVMPYELAKTITKSGTTTIIADPHEIVNVCGARAVEFLLEATQVIPLNVFLMLPSCVPCTQFETNGASFTTNELINFINHPRVLGLGEVMSYTDVLDGENEILEKIIACESKMIDGHAPGLGKYSLQGYASACVRTDHECTSFNEAMDKVRAGLSILVREGSAAHNLGNLIKGLLDSKYSLDRFLFCTDDKHLADIQINGHIRNNVQMAIKLGMNPISAIKMATYNTAVTYGLKDIGAIAPSYKADLVVLDDIKNATVNSVYKDGVLIEECFKKKYSMVVDNELLSTIKNKEINCEDISLKVSGKTNIIEMVPNELTTKHIIDEVKSVRGLFVQDSECSKIVVVERHGKNGNIAVAPLKGYGITCGAVATSVAHDSHNIIAVGDNDEDIVLAINHLKHISGGYVICGGGNVLGELPLSVAGLMSLDTAENVQGMTQHLLELAFKMGVPKHIDPFISLSFLALPVIPEIRLTDKGLFDVKTFSLIKKEY